MKKATSKKTSTSKEEPSKVTPKVIEKSLDVAKEVVGLGKEFSKWGQEKERTKRAHIDAQAAMSRDKAITEQVVARACVDMGRIESEHAKNVMDHRENMKRLEIEQEKASSRLRQEERVLDKVLEQVDSPAQLAESYRTLLISRDES